MRPFRKTSYKAYFLIIAAVLAVMSIPKGATENIRGGVIASLSSTWERIGNGKSWVIRLWSSNSMKFRIGKQTLTIPEEIQRLNLENEQLSNELRRLRDLTDHERFVDQKLDELKNMVTGVDDVQRSFYKHYAELRQLLKLQVQAIPARVIHRDPSYWDSSLWVNVGNVDNQNFDRIVVAKNSPVLLGTSVVGVVDYVGRHQSRVRLITDPGLMPSVRAVRGYKQNALLSEHVIALIEALTMRDDLFFSEDYNDGLVASLNHLKEHLYKYQEEWFLAKGILRGATKPSYRSNGKFLRGVGFNYDFTDERGPARDLRTGIPLNDEVGVEMPILKVNDLLVTTGMDGVFPEGLRVAEVTKIDLLKEGGYSYDLEARSTASDLDALSMVFIIPPVGYDESDQPALR
ncbi:MAG: rod shape-determining protein MreC [Chlamydiales bacterium]